MLVHASINSPVGKLRIVASDAGLHAVLWPNEDPKRVRLADSRRSTEHPVITETGSQLTEYFAGTRTVFDLPIQPFGTDFQKTCWKALSEIPFGTTATYGELATAMGKPGSARAVGGAVGRNPISVVIPCHRIVGKDGSLTGFAGGLETKRALLALEGSGQDESP